jgi:MinD-like ATPase involved in chromosome partitioning or flagellar assembly
MTKCIAFHSYKGGTGKTTLACNSAGALTKRGYKVCLLDLDIYAPSFQIYFQREPPKGINNFLDSDAKVEDVMFDATDIINNTKALDTDNKNNYQSSATQEREQTKKTGKLWIGFSSPLKKDIFKLEMADKDTKKEVIRRFINLRERLVSEYDADFIILDTSPGMRFWSINTLAIADVLLLTLKSGEFDIEGTRKVVDEIYTNFTKFGSKAFLLCNRVAGYCVPHTIKQNSGGLHSSNVSSAPPPFVSNSVLPSVGNNDINENNKGKSVIQLQEEQVENTLELIDKLSSQIGIKTISSIPCFCDIQFLRREFLTALKYPQHPFAKQIQQLVDTF